MHRTKHNVICVEILCAHLLVLCEEVDVPLPGHLLFPCFWTPKSDTGKATPVGGKDASFIRSQNNIPPAPLPESHRQVTCPALFDIHPPTMTLLLLAGCFATLTRPAHAHGGLANYTVGDTWYRGCVPYHSLHGLDPTKPFIHPYLSIIFMTDRPHTHTATTPRRHRPTSSASHG
jgi:hypothetical protein